MTNKERQTKFRNQMKEQGLTQVAGWVPEHQSAAVTMLLRQLRDNPHLEVGLLRDPETGRFVKLT